MLSDDDIFHCENDSPADLKVFVGGLRREMRQLQMDLNQVRAERDEWRQRVSDVIARIQSLSVLPVGRQATTYPEAGERLVRPPLTDEQIMIRDNKQCRRCGHWDPTRGGGKHSARHLHVVTLEKEVICFDFSVLPAGERVTLCARCKGLVEGEQG